MARRAGVVFACLVTLAPACQKARPAHRPTEQERTELPEHDAASPRSSVGVRPYPKKTSLADSEDIPALIEKLGDEDDVVRTDAVLELGDLGPEAAAAVPALIRRLKDQDEFVREWTIDALGEIGPAARAAVPHLIRAQWNVDELTRDKVIEALRKIGPGNKSAVLGLVERLRIEDAFGREEVIEQLGQIGPEAGAAVPALRKALRDESEFGEFVREAAAAALRKITRGSRFGLDRGVE